MEWISVKDRLPAHDVRVLVCNCYGIYIAHIRQYAGKDSIWWDISESGESLSIINGTVKGLNEFEAQNLFDKHVTHWMPLPQPPKNLDK